MQTLRDLRRNAIAVARETGWHRPTGYGLGPVGQHRDSDILERSNFAVILADLQAVDDRVTVVRWGHWAVGWVEELLVPLTLPVASRVAEWRKQLAGYPIADEDDYSEREREAIGGAWSAWLRTDTFSDVADLLADVDPEGERADATLDEMVDSGDLESRYYALAYEADEFPYCDGEGDAVFPCHRETCEAIAAEIIARWAHEDDRAARGALHRCAECDEIREVAGQGTLGLMSA